MGSKYDIELMVNVARMYYDRGMKQDEIAKEVKVSRSSISLILSDARENGIVEIKVRNPLDDNAELSAAFKERFNIKNCYVVPTSVKDPEILLKVVVRKAVDVFNSFVKSGDLIGLAWGRTCYQFMTDYKAAGFHENLKAVPLTGGTLLNSRRYQLNELVRLYAGKISGEPIFFHAPAFPKTSNDYELYMQSGELKSVLELWRKIDIAVMTFGAPPSDNPDNVISHMTLAPDEIEQLKASAVGDICARHYDINGNFIDNSSEARIIGAAPETLKKIGNCIAVVTGGQKLSSVIGGLRTGVADTLIIDEPTATGVLNLLAQTDT